MCQHICQRDIQTYLVWGDRCNETAISLMAGCELFLRYATRTSAQEMEDFAAAKARIIEVHQQRHTFNNVPLIDVAASSITWQVACLLQRA